MGKRETAYFCSQLKMLLASGIPLIEALSIVKDLKNKPKMIGRIEIMIDKINDGYSFSEAARELLPQLAIGLIQAAERVGNLEETLGRLAKYYEEKAELDEKVVASLTYPCFVLALSLLSVMALVFFVLPGLKGLFADLGTELPLITSLILNSSDWLSTYGLCLVVLLVVFVALFFRMKRFRRQNIDELILRLPLIGKLARQELTIQGLGTLGALLSGGTPISEALVITANSSRNQIFKNLISQARAEVENGRKLSEALSESGFFPTETLQMLRVGENSGQLDEMLISTANFLAKGREHFIKRLTTLLEPALTLSVGVVVGFIVLAVFLPLVNMISSLQ